MGESEALKPLQDIIAKMGTDIGDLGEIPKGLGPLGDQIAGYGSSIEDLGKTTVDWTPIEEKIGGFQTAEDLGDINVRDVTPEDEEVDEEQKDLVADLQRIILDLASADPMDAEALRADPVNASLLLDLEQRMIKEQDQMEEEMQRLGILASGETAGKLADLSEAEARAVSDILSSGAERARADREVALGGRSSVWPGHRRNAPSCRERDLFPPLDDPVDFTFEHYPPLVAVVTMPVGPTRSVLQGGERPSSTSV